MPDPSTYKSQTAIIIGGGISGLSCALELIKQCPAMKVTVLESSDQAGGVIKSVQDGDLLIECGPESFSTMKPEMTALAAQLGISEHIIPTNQQNRRSFLSLKQRLHALPEGLMMFAPSNLWAFAFSDIFSATAKMRMSLDLILPRRSQTSDESLASFITRRLGKEALDKLAEPMIGGIYGGDVKLLSAAATIPQMVSLEKSHGSIIKGLMKARRKEPTSAKSSGPRYSALASFDSGISLVVKKLLQSLPENCLLTNKHVRALEFSRNGKRWNVSCADGSAYDADFVVLSTPAKRSAALLASVNPSLAKKLQRIERSSALIINLVYERSAIKHALNGFGFVVPKTEGMLISACSFSSIKFKSRSADNQVLLRVFTGGAMKNYAMEMSDNALARKCHDELKVLIGASMPPLTQHISRYEEAIPQYLVGHNQLVEDINKDLLHSPGIEVIGNSFIGVGLPDCIKTANVAAKKIADRLALESNVTQFAHG